MWPISVLVGKIHLSSRRSSCKGDWQQMVIRNYMTCQNIIINKLNIKKYKDENINTNPRNHNLSIKCCIRPYLNMRTYTHLHVVYKNLLNYIGILIKLSRFTYGLYIVSAIVRFYLRDRFPNQRQNFLKKKRVQ